MGFIGGLNANARRVDTPQFRRDAMILAGKGGLPLSVSIFYRIYLRIKVLTRAAHSKNQTDVKVDSGISQKE